MVRRRHCWIGCVASGLMVAATVGRAEVDAAIRSLRHQDMAFSIAAEGYREIQLMLIQTDYRNRVERIDQIRDPQARHQALTFADVERYLRERKVAVNVDRLQTTYRYARRSDEQRAGIAVPSTVNLTAAARYLKEFIPTTPAPADDLILRDDNLQWLNKLVADARIPILEEEEPPPPIHGAHRYLDLTELLHSTSATDDPVLAAVMRLLRDAPVPATNPVGPLAVGIISYRAVSNQIAQLVVQLLHAPVRPGLPAARRPIQPASLAKDQFADVLDEWADLSTAADVIGLGPDEQVRRRQRAIERLRFGEVSFLREQTIEPLELIIVLPRPSAYLPLSLRPHVAGIIIRARLDLREWHAQIRWIGVNRDATDRIAATLATWHDLAQTLAKRYGDSDSARTLTEFLGQGKLTITGNVVTAEGRAPAKPAALGFERFLRWFLEATL